jgi:four helix bundle protein
MPSRARPRPAPAAVPTAVPAAVAEPSPALATAPAGPPAPPPTLGADAPLPPGYRGLRVWQRALELATGVYSLSADFPASAQDALAVPMRRAAAAIAAAIAEGNVRYSPREYAHYLSQAIGTVAEVETLLFLASRLGYAPEERFTPLLAHCVEIGRMLRGLSRTVQSPRAPIEGGATRRRTPARATPAH